MGCVQPILHLLSSLKSCQINGLEKKKRKDKNQNKISLSATLSRGHSVLTDRTQSVPLIFLKLLLSTIRTIFTFNKNLTLDLPSALTWLFPYNHKGPCGLILCFLGTMIIKKHLLSDFFFFHLIIPLVSLPSWICH